MRIGITGTPGAGKTTAAKALASVLGYAYLDVKALIDEKKWFYVRRGDKEKTVYLTKLKKGLSYRLNKYDDLVLDSHLLCEFYVPVDVMVVLRCEPEELRKRLAKRRYPKPKTEDNLLAEALDYCLVRAESFYPKVVQIDATQPLTVGQLWEKIREGRADAADWSEWLNRHAGRDTFKKGTR